MKKALSLSMLFCLFLLFNVNAQTDPVVEKIIEIGTTDNQTMDHLDILCNRFGGRPIGSDAYENAAKWAASKFEEWGMEVIMDEVGELPVGFNRGPWFGRMLSDEGMHLHFATPSYTSGTKGVQRGHVLIEPKSEAEFKRMKGALKGAWVLISGENEGWPIDWSENANHNRDSIKEENTKISKENSQIRRDNWNNRGTDNPQKEQLLLIE
jgi:carboxypeptidase Q